MLKTLIKTPKPKTYSTNTRSDQTHITPILHTLLSSLIKQKNQHTDQTLTTYQQTPSISFRVSNGGEEKLKKKRGEMRDFLQSAWGLSHFHSGLPKLLIFLANLVDLHHGGSGVDPSALAWAQWCFLVTNGAGLGSMLLPWVWYDAKLIILREKRIQEKERERESGK